MEYAVLGPPVQILTSNQNLQWEISALKTQMDSLQPGSPEYSYDQLQLTLEDQTEKVREEHPDLNPLNAADNHELNEFLDQDPAYQNASAELNEMRPSVSSSWGIPWIA